MKNDCIILFSIACAIIMVLSNFNIAGTLGRGIKWLMFGLFGVMEYIFNLSYGKQRTASCREN